MSPDCQSSRGSCSPFLTVGLFCVFYVLAFAFLAYQFIANGKFDAIWIVGIVGWPFSLLANYLSGVVGYSFYENRNIPIDLLFLFVFGVVQYGMIGYGVGKVIQRFRKAGT